jgi:hypothetical protein
MLATAADPRPTSYHSKYTFTRDWRGNRTSIFHSKMMSCLFPDELLAGSKRFYEITKLSRRKVVALQVRGQLAVAADNGGVKRMHE